MLLDLSHNSGHLTSIQSCVTFPCDGRAFEFETRRRTFSFSLKGGRLEVIELGYDWLDTLSLNWTQDV